MRRRNHYVCTVRLRDKATGELLDLPNHLWPTEIGALIVEAGRYWWIRLYYGSVKSQWELTPVDKIREYSDGRIGVDRVARV